MIGASAASQRPVPLERTRGGLPLPAVDDELAASLLDGLDAVETRLLEAVSHADALADATSKHLVLAGGKRVRPMLALLASHLGDPQAPGVLTAAVAVELVHLASLYHDDVMDSAPLRRGAPSAQAVWGNDLAILTGDILFARASRLVAELGPDAVRHQALVFERLCLGQMHETVGPRADQDPIAHHIGVLADKTGSLIALSARFGATLAGVGPRDVARLVSYGEKVGVAFQLADDVLDLAHGPQGPQASPGATGKVAGTDLREGIPTLPVLLARAAAADGDRRAAGVVALLDVDLSGDEALARAVDALADSPWTDGARAVAHRWADEAVDSLTGLDGGADSPVAAALVSFAATVIDRDR